MLRRINVFTTALLIAAASCMRPDKMSQARKMRSQANVSQGFSAASLSQTSEVSFANKTGDSMSRRSSSFFGPSHKLLSLAERLLDGRATIQEFGSSEHAEKAQCTCPRAGRAPIPDPTQYSGHENTAANHHAKCAAQTTQAGCINDHECEWTQPSDGPWYQQAAVSECRANIRHMYGMFLAALDPSKCQLTPKDKWCARAVAVCFFKTPDQCGKNRDRDHCALESCSDKPGSDSECMDDFQKNHPCYDWWGMHPDKLRNCPLTACDMVSNANCGKNGKPCALFEHEFCGLHRLEKVKVCEATDAAWLESLAPGRGRFFRDFVACQRETTCPKEGPKVDVSVSVSVSVGR